MAVSRLSIAVLCVGFVCAYSWDYESITVTAKTVSSSKYSTPPSTNNNFPESTSYSSSSSTNQQTASSKPNTASTPSASRSTRPSQNQNSSEEEEKCHSPCRSCCSCPPSRSRCNPCDPCSPCSNPSKVRDVIKGLIVVFLQVRANLTADVLPLDLEAILDGKIEAAVMAGLPLSLVDILAALNLDANLDLSGLVGTIVGVVDAVLNILLSVLFHFFCIPVHFKFSGLLLSVLANLNATISALLNLDISNVDFDIAAAVTSLIEAVVKAKINLMGLDAKILADVLDRINADIAAKVKIDVAAILGLFPGVGLLPCLVSVVVGLLDPLISLLVAILSVLYGIQIDANVFANILGIVKAAVSAVIDL